MLKIAGCLLIMSAGSFAGISLARNYARRPGELRSMVTALQMLETEISYTATPLPEALTRIAVRCDKAITPLFSRAGEELLAQTGCTAGEAWETALNKFYALSSTLPSDLAVLRNLGMVLGISDGEDQCKHLRLAREQLKREVITAEQQAAKYVKLWNYLGLLGSLALILLLY
ncbi:MAG: stage III sporulation protein AB [Peptococcaceae bacterium]